MNRWQRLPVWLLLLASMLLLSGCMLFRIVDFKQQFCDYQANFELLVGDVIELRMHHPALLDSDVVWLLGAEPTRREYQGNTLELVYVVEKDQPLASDEYAIPLRLRFRQVSGDFLLSAGVIDKNLGSVVTPGLIDETVAHTCDSQTSVANSNVTVDLSDLAPEGMPRRSDIEAAVFRIVAPVLRRGCPARRQLASSAKKTTGRYANSSFRDQRTA